MVRVLWMFVLTFLALLAAASLASAAEVNEIPNVVLRENWFIQSSADLHSDGASISSVGFQTSGWYPAPVPCTILSALVEDKVYSDPYFGMNLRSIPGTTYPIFEDFANIQMPPASPFRQSWCQTSWSRRQM